MTWEADGISLEILMKGLTFFSVQLGLTNTKVYCQGDAICGAKDMENTGRNPVFLQSGMSLEEKSSLLYSTGSLFDSGGAENQAEKPHYVCEQQNYMERFTEGYALQKFGAMFLDYVYTAESQTLDVQPGGSQASGDSSLPEENLHENSSIRCIFGPSHLIISTSATQRLEKFYVCLNNHEYEPYSQTYPERIDETRQPPNDEEVRAMEDFIPTRSYHVTFLRPSVWVMANDLPYVNVRAKKVISHRKQKKVSIKIISKI
jgi:hypothetical protein